MFRLPHKASPLHHYYCISSTDLKTTIHALEFLINPHNIHLRPISSTPSSPTLDFLLNSCGLDLKVALLSAKKVTLKTTEKPDLVLDILRKHGITNTQINQIVSKSPTILNCHPEKTIKPKIEFLHSLGIPGSGIAEVLIRDSSFVWKNLEKTIQPCGNFLKKCVGGQQVLLQALKNSSRYFGPRFESLMGQNIETLRDYGARESTILQIIVYFPGSMLVANDRFKGIVEEVKEMGFDPSSASFGYAVRTMAGLKESRWKEKWEVYLKLGFSEEEISTVFKKHPFCLFSSEKKIRKVMDFVTQKLKWSPADICLCPILLRMSLENRIIPRYTVLELLNAECVVKKKMDVQSLARVFVMSENDFLRKFVIKYQEAVPKVVNVYKGRIGLANMQDEADLKELN